MQFQCTYIGSDLGLEISSLEPIKISILKKESITVTLRLPYEDEISIGYKNDQIFCVAELIIQPPKKCISVFDSLISDKKPNYIMDYVEQLASRFPSDNFSSDKVSFPLGIFPLDFQEFSNDIYAQLTNSISRVIKLFRWRYQLDKQKQNPFAAKQFCWSYDGCKWNNMPHSIRVFMEDHHILTVTKSEIATIQELADDEINEPIHNDLLLEAYNSYRLNNNRSAFLIAYSSLEIGIKNMISEFVPEISWIISEMQSPPLQKLLSDDLINIIKNDAGKELFSSLDLKKIRIKLQKLGQTRNELAHGRKVDIKKDEVLEILDYTKNFNRMIDNIRGYHWSPIDINLIKKKI
jgi:hypothetical protein